MYSKAKHPLKIARVLGHDIVTVGQRGGGDKEIVPAYRLAGGCCLCPYVGVDPRYEQVEGNHRQNLQQSFDESLPSCAL